MANGKTDFYINILLFFYSIAAITISFMLVNNVFYTYLSDNCGGGFILLGEVLSIINVICNLFVFYYAIKTMLVFSVKAKFNIQNKAAALLFVACLLYVLTERFFFLMDNFETRYFDFLSCIPLLLWGLITIFMASEKRKFIQETEEEIDKSRLV